MSSRHEWLQIDVQKQTWHDDGWDEGREKRQKDRFANGWTYNACKEMCSRTDDHAKICSWTDELGNNAWKGMCSLTNNHAKMCSRMNGWEIMKNVLTDGWTDEHALSLNRWTCQAFQHISKEKCVNATSSEPMTIKESVHFAMRMWSNDTPWGHPSPKNNETRHAH